MFGYVTASYDELQADQRRRYGALYCGICRSIGNDCSQVCRLSLSYDMVFLALVLSSLYEPEETQGARRCLPHPVRKRPFTESPAVRYAAQMNVALAYYSAKDKWLDDGRLDAHGLELALRPHWEEVSRRYPRQCEAIVRELDALAKLEKENCPNPDLPANCFGRLLAEVFIMEEDRWSDRLRDMAFWLGRYVYLADAAADLDHDRRSGSYNPFLSAGIEPGKDNFMGLLMAEMARCTQSYEMLPLVQDKAIMDNILYSGIWLTYRHKIRHRWRRQNDD